MIAAYLKFIKPYQWIVVGAVFATLLMVYLSFRWSCVNLKDLGRLRCDNFCGQLLPGKLESTI